MDATPQLHEDGLPIILWKPSGEPEVFNKVLECLIEGYKEFTHSYPDSDTITGWSLMLPNILDAFKGYPIILEYPVLGGPERVDVIVVGRGRALIIENKYWVGDVSRNWVDFLVIVNGERRIDPCYQLENYIAKFKYLHTASKYMEFDAIIYIRKTRYIDTCKIIYERADLDKYISWLGEPGTREDVKHITEGSFQISKGLINFVKNSKIALYENAIDALKGGGYGLTEDQLKVVEAVLGSLEKGEDKAYFVKGVSGSGKTLVALTLFLEAVSRGYNTLLTYRNNRLLNTLRISLGGKISGLIKFYSMGQQGNFRGVAEKNFPVEKYGMLDLIIYDEAQRMTEENIEISLRRSKVKVYFYDDEQLLIGDEAGVLENYVDYANRNKVGYEIYNFDIPRRIPRQYLDAVRSLLDGGSFSPRGIEFKVFEDINDMIEKLNDIKHRGARVALVAAFTETPGNKNNPKAPDNLRVGYPLCRKYDTKMNRCLEISDLDIYRDTGLEIYWLMHERKQYPKYWMVN